MDLVAQYVEQVLKILREKQAVAEQVAQLDKLSETLGLTQYDLDYLERQFQEGLQRGEGYMRHKEWNKAINELEQSILLKPLHTDGLYKMALAYQNRYRQGRQEKDRLKALEYAERAVQTDAGKEEAIALIATLRKKNLLWKSWAIRHLWLILLVFTLILGGLVYWITLPSEQEVVQQIQLYAQRQDIPIELDNMLLKAGFRLDKETSFARLEPTGLAYHLRGHLYSPTHEVGQMAVEVEIWSKSGKLLQKKEISLLSEDDFEARPEDYLPIATLLQIPQNQTIIGKARLVGKLKEHSRSENVYEKPKEILLKQEDTEANKAQGLEIVERYHTLKPAPDDFEHTLCLAYRHQQKNKPLRNWRVEIQWFDRQDRLVHTETITLLENQEPMLKADKWRAKTWRFQVPLKQKDFSRYQILVLRAE
jgi:hypothetical protein